MGNNLFSFLGMRICSFQVVAISEFPGKKVAVVGVLIYGLSPFLMI